MSWEHTQCPACLGRAIRVSADHDAEGRIVMTFRCPTCPDADVVSVPEPDDNFRSRQELMAKEAAAQRSA